MNHPHPRSPDEVQQEILERTVRIESRLVQMGDHVGANLRSKQRIDVEPTQFSVVVYVDALDVSLSRIATEITASPHWTNAKPGMHHAEIRHGNRRSFVMVGTIALMR